MGWFIISRGKPNKRYTPEFKKLVVETMLNEKLSYSETGRRLIWSEQPRQDYGALQAGTHWLSGLLQQSQNQGKIEGLAACGSQTTSPFGSLNNFYFERLYNFWGAVQGTILLFILCRCAEHRIWYWNSCACIWGVSMCPICLFWTERNTSSWSCC